MDTAEKFTFTATGDAIITRSVMAREGHSERFDAVLDRLRAADAAMTNLEVVLTGERSYATPPRPVRDQYQYLGSFPGLTIRSPPEVLDELAAMGIDHYAAASNHSYDFGRRGMVSTMNALDERNLPYAGLGRDLPTARRPAYSTTRNGRVGHVAASASIAPGSEAGPPSSLLPGRPGISPLHVNWTYKVTPERLAQLESIADAVGIEDVKRTWRAREDPDPDATDGYAFMHMLFEEVDDESEEGIEYSLYEPDRTAILRQIREANAAADWVIASLHAHQGPNGTRNVPETPSFLVDFARECVDAGADAFVGTGPHVLRGIDIYDGKPIFYSLGNFFCQFETMDRMPAQSFEYYGVDDDRFPADVFDARYYENGEPTGNLAYPEYWWTVVPTCRFGSDGTLDRVELLPCSLGRTRDRPSRGTPLRASEREAATILEQVRELSEPFGTTVERDGNLGVIPVE